jgi:hypothetical protein
MRVFFTCVCLAITVLSMTAGAVFAGPCLVLSGEDPVRLLMSLPVEEGGVFSLEFVNSIYLAPVRETFVYESKSGISVIRVESPHAGVFEYYGILPDGPDFAVLRRNVAEIRIRSHDYGHHRLTLGDRSLRFKGLVADGESLIIRVLRDGSCGP